MTKQNIVRLIGTAMGLLAGILILSIGFFKTLLLAALAYLGWFLSGSRMLPPKFYEALGKLSSKISDALSKINFRSDDK